MGPAIAQCIQNWVCASALGAGIGTAVSTVVTGVWEHTAAAIQYAVANPTYTLGCDVACWIR